VRLHQSPVPNAVEVKHLLVAPRHRRLRGRPAPMPEGLGALHACSELTPRPIGQLAPVEWFGQYPFRLRYRYCWW